MPKIKPISLGSANPHQKKLLEGLKAKMGRIPEIYATIAHSPTTLEAMLTYNENLKRGSLSLKEIEAIVWSSSLSRSSRPAACRQPRC